MNGLFVGTTLGTLGISTSITTGVLASKWKIYNTYRILTGKKQEDDIHIKEKQIEEGAIIRGTSGYISSTQGIGGSLGQLSSNLMFSSMLQKNESEDLGATDVLGQEQITTIENRVNTMNQNSQYIQQTNPMYTQPMYNTQPMYATQPMYTQPEVPPPIQEVPIQKQEEKYIQQTNNYTLTEAEKQVAIEIESTNLEVPINKEVIEEVEETHKYVIPQGEVEEIKSKDASGVLKQREVNGYILPELIELEKQPQIKLKPKVKIKNLGYYLPTTAEIRESEEDLIKKKEEEVNIKKEEASIKKEEDSIPTVTPQNKGYYTPLDYKELENLEVNNSILNQVLNQQEDIFSYKDASVDNLYQTQYLTQTEAQESEALMNEIPKYNEEEKAYLKELSNHNSEKIAEEYNSTITLFAEPEKTEDATSVLAKTTELEIENMEMFGVSTEEPTTQLMNTFVNIKRVDKGGAFADV